MSEIIELGDPRLRKKSAPIDDVFGESTIRLVDDMVKALSQRKGIGIAAPQIGVLKQAFLVAPDQLIEPPYDNLDTGLVVFNPSIAFNSNKTTKEWEGCLSIPGIRGLVPRVCDISITYTNCHGETRVDSFSGFTARIFLHEFDHLNGTMFIDRLANIQTELITDEYYKQMMENES